MSRRTTTLLILLLLVAVLGVAAIILQPRTSEGKGSIAMLDIGQGDSFLITAPSGAQLLIDGGKDPSVLGELARVMPAGDRSIDVVIGTHPDADHIGGLGPVLDRYDVGLFLTSEVEGDTQLYRDLLAQVVDQRIPAYYVRKGMNIVLDPTTQFKTLFPDRDVRHWETNTASVVGRLQMGSRSALFTGDSPTSIEEYLVKTDPKDLNVDLLKLGHHGSKTSSSLAFLKAASPALSLISAGVNNRYGHPAKETIERLTSLNLKWVSTQDHGQVTLTTDGTKWLERDER
jgi:competence protein ComEC